MTDRPPLVEGCAVRATPATLQAAVDRAGARYWARWGQPPTHVSLPSWADPAAQALWTLRLGGPVIVDRVMNGHSALRIV